MPTPDSNDSLYQCLDESTKKEISISLENCVYVRVYSIRLRKNWSSPRSESMLPELAVPSKIAMKEFTRNVGGLSPADICSKEFDNLKKLSHENIVVVYDICLEIDPEDPSSMPSYLMEIGECSLHFILYTRMSKLVDSEDSRYIVPHLPDGQAVNAETKNRYTKDHLFTWLYQVASALSYLHENDHLHRDVKSTNVLLFNRKTLCKLCDFETCREIDPTGMTPKVGTVRWRAPELTRMDRDSRTAAYDKPADCFSFGVLMCEAVFREKPFSDYPDDALSMRDEDVPDRPVDAKGAMSIDKGHSPRVLVDKDKSVFSSLPDSFWQLLENLLSWNPEDRWDANRVLSELRRVDSCRTDGRLAKIVVDRNQLTDTAYRANDMVPSRRRSYLSKQVIYKVSIELNKSSEDRIKTILRDYSGSINVKASIPDGRVDEIRHDFSFQSSRLLKHDIGSHSEELLGQVWQYCLDNQDGSFTSWMSSRFNTDTIPALRGVEFEVVIQSTAEE